MKDNKNKFKKDLHEWLAEMKARREINRKRDEEQAQWDAQFNAPLNLKDRDQKIMNDITLTDRGTALDHASGFEYDIHGFDMDGHEAITIPALDLISYDEGDNWQTIE